MSQSVPRPVVVELFGLPGSGKSYTARLLSKHEGVTLVPTLVSRSTMLRGALRYWGSAFRWIFFLATETFRSGEWGLLRYRLSLIMSAFGRYWLAQRAPARAVVLDEGFLQRLLSVSSREVPAGRVTALMRGLWPDHVLVIEMREPSFQRYDAGHIRMRQDVGGKWKEQMLCAYVLLKELLHDRNVHHTQVTSSAAAEAVVENLDRMGRL